MAINAQSGVGKIRLFNDFFGIENYVALTADTAPGGDFYFGGAGFSNGAAGSAYLQSNALSGVVRLTTAATNKNTCFVGTDICFDVGLMGTLVVESRVRFADLTAKAAFIGFTSILTLNDEMADFIDYGGSETLDLGATLAGFFLSSEFTDSEAWHMVHNGGATTGQTDTTAVNADEDAVPGKWQVLRCEIDNNGTARWYVDGVKKQTIVGAISTSTDLAVCCGVTENSGADAAIMDVDYLLVTANRDWNA